MDELALLSEMRAEVPADAEYPAARRTLLAEIEGRPAKAAVRRTRRPVLISGLLVGAVAAGAVVVAATLGSGDPRRAPSRGAASPPVRLVAVTSPTALAANAAALAKDAPTPRPTQWIYTRMVTTTSHERPSGAQVQDPGTRRVKEKWDRVDFLKFARYENGRLVFANGMPSQIGGWPANLDYSYLRKLPTEPGALLATIRYNLTATNTPLDSGQVFEAVVALMENYPVLPAKLNAALYGALARSKAVGLGHVTDRAGRRVLSLDHTDPESGIQTSILVDPSSYTYAGQRRVVVAESRMSGLDGTRTLRKGSLLTDEAVLAAAIVDEAGQR